MFVLCCVLFSTIYSSLWRRSKSKSKKPLLLVGQAVAFGTTISFPELRANTTVPAMLCISFVLSQVQQWTCEYWKRDPHRRNKGEIS
jgi:hypothetical protein